MTTRPWLAAAALAVTGTAATLSTMTLSGPARAQVPSPSAPTIPAAATSATARPALPMPNLTMPAALASLTIPTEKSELPKATEWGGAALVEPTRRSLRASSCKVSVLREYVNVSCPFNTGVIRQFVGGTKDVEVWVTPKPMQNDSFDIWSGPQGGRVVFPLRRGDGYVFQFFTIESGYEGFDVGASVVVDASWSESRSTPTVVLR